MKYYTNLNSINKRFIFFSYRNFNGVIAKKNNQEIKEYIKNNSNYTFLDIYIRSFFSYRDINFIFYEFQSKKQNVIVKLFFVENDNQSLNSFINFLQKNDFLKFINNTIEKYNFLIKLLPKNVMIYSKINILKAKEMAK
jgi:hypothetical protein